MNAEARRLASQENLSRRLSAKNPLWFKCATFASGNDIPFSEEPEGHLCEQILPGCQCHECGFVGVSDLRRYYASGVNALDSDLVLALLVHSSH